MRIKRKGDPSRYSGLKILFATSVLLAPLAVKSTLTVLMRTWSKKRGK